MFAVDGQNMWPHRRHCCLAGGQTIMQTTPFFTHSGRQGQVELLGDL
jgi:hypothetical protein